MDIKELSLNLLDNIVPENSFKVPTVVKSIIVSFYAFGQKGKVAGGAVRDFALGKKIKDYDVIIETDAETHHECESDIREIAIHANRFGYKVKDITWAEGQLVDTESSEFGNNDLKAIIQLKHPDGTQVEILLVNCTIEEYIDSFTVSLSKISYNVLSGKIFMRDDFKRSVYQKKCMVYNPRGLQQCAIDHYVNRIKLKYPEYEFILYKQEYLWDV